ncbi:MAG: N-acetylmuramoyl-L-alanine amidase, partial [Gemmatimonadota bacterium]
LEVGLTEEVWGYRTDYRVASDGSAELVFDIRRPPEIDGGDPLEGRRIAVDPGHPGAGATGPTGYYEGDANLAIARRLVTMLEEEGAEPILIRDDTLPMGLYERTRRAREQGAELFVSIHNNALPDGVRPFREHGTSTYYFHSHARDLAQHVQGGMLASMGLRDLGVFYGNLAVAREPWMPSVLAEGAFMMIPRHEAALKQPVFQRRYARGVLDGIRTFLRERAR